MLANVEELVDIDGQANDPIAGKVQELGQGLDTEHQWHVCHLEPTPCKICGKRRLARPTDSAQHEVRLVEIAGLFSVVALDGELDRLDATEILRGQW